MSRAPRTRQRRTTWRPPLTLDEIDALATDLTAELAEHAGNPEAVHAVLRDWLARSDFDRLAFVGLAVVRDVFAQHLTRVPTSELPPGALVLTEGNPT